MEAPLCRRCGERHWGVCGDLGGANRAQGRARIDGPSVGSKALPAREGIVARFYAPEGECRFCDARREASRAGMRRRRSIKEQP